jgi:hypothetical protein
VQHTHTNKGKFSQFQYDSFHFENSIITVLDALLYPLIYAATSPHTDVFQWTILTTVTLASSYNSFPDDGVTAPKHVGAVLMSVLT